MDANHKGAGTYGLLSPHGKMYIGKSVAYRSRMQDHKSDAYKKKDGDWKEKKYLYRALRKWGWDRFEKFIFQKHDGKRADIDDVLNKQEIALIAEFETFTNKSKGYNLTAGGEGCSGRKMTPEQRAAQSARKSTPEAKAAQSAASKERWADPAFRAKSIAAFTEVLNRPEVKAKISAAKKKTYASAKGTKLKEAISKRFSKPVVSKLLTSGENPIKEYQLIYHAGQRAAAVDLSLLFGMKFSQAGLSLVIGGKRTHHKGFKFENYSGAPGQPTPEQPIKRIRLTNI